jgi:hypothetical protein
MVKEFPSGIIGQNTCWDWILKANRKNPPAGYGEFRVFLGGKWLSQKCKGLKKKEAAICSLFFCCEGEDRTPDLRVMSPTSYRCSTSRFGLQM